MLNSGYPTDSKSIFESDFSATIGSGGVTLNVTSGNGGSTGNTDSAPPPSMNQGISFLGLALVGLLIWIVLR